MEHHPDTLVAQGMPEDFIEIATEKIATINAAYDEISKQRGMK
jgi:DnaJ like chaperone protein